MDSIYIEIKVNEDCLNTDWSINAIYSDKSEALITTWKNALTNTAYDFHLEQWDKNKKVATFYFESARLRHSYTSDFISTQLEIMKCNKTLPDVLKTYMNTKVHHHKNIEK